MKRQAPRRLVVRIDAAGAGGRLADAVHRLLVDAGIDEDGAVAVARGAVFVDGKRILEPGARVAPGQTVQVTARAAEPALSVLALDDDLAVLDKPPGISSTPDLTDRAGSLLGLAERRFGTGLHLLGRLDRDVSGVVVALRTERARKAAVELRRAGRIERVYLALVAPAPAWDEREVDAPIGRDARDPKRRAVAGRDAEPARTMLRVRERLGAGTALVEARPVTGRTHQIRVHLAHAGSPIVGDRTYGGLGRLVSSTGEVHAVPRVLLHAARLAMPHPGGRGALALESPLPEDFVAVLEAVRRTR